ncbi:hypothetical protein [Arcticibacterium luteifluviistationis]|uniref:Lipoprotein n=1 Tax=Arcticibacterium luteifluviistationis TaxID=1784714 RepID=A0A2Z4GGG8_9BACT|nr:hypothetical protein [Arcticibacterium luteifluviistationis]AWV99883.1 hypothetical protein DJ013_17575 [Arcticibacterium luteifluviistationis]
MRYFLISFFLIGFFSCRPKPIDMGAVFSADVFKSDRNACDGLRTSFKEALVANKDSLIGHSENDIFSTLGRYDLQMLDSRNQKVFIYFLEAGPQCESVAKPSESPSMAVYFNATKLVKEITFQDGVL